MRRLSVELRLSEICVFFLPKNIPRHHSRPRFTFLLLCAAIPKICIEGGLTEGPFSGLPVKETTANRIRMTRNLFICLFIDVGNFKYFSTAKEGPQQAKLLLVGVLRVCCKTRRSSRGIAPPGKSDPFSLRCLLMAAVLTSRPLLPPSCAL